MIRPAEHKDLDALVELGRQFHAVSGYVGLIDFNEAAVRECVLKMIDSPDSLALVFDDGGVVGTILGTLTRSWINPSTVLATEVAWWVTPSYRHKTAGARLVFAFIDWAQQQGAKAACMMCLDALPDAEYLYGKLGFTKVETTYIRSFS